MEQGFSGLFSMLFPMREDGEVGSVSGLKIEKRRANKGEKTRHKQDGHSFTEGNCYYQDCKETKNRLFIPSPAAGQSCDMTPTAPSRPYYDKSVSFQHYEKSHYLSKNNTNQPQVDALGACKHTC